MRNLNNFLPPSLVAGSEPACGSPASGQQRGALTLISKVLPRARGPANSRELSFGLPGSFPGSQESKPAPETDHEPVLRTGRHPGFLLPTLTQEWAGLGFQAQRLNLWVNRVSASAEHFFGVHRSLKRSSILGKPNCLPALSQKISQQILCAHSPERISPGLVKTGTERYFQPWNRFACLLSVPSPKQ